MQNSIDDGFNRRVHADDDSATAQQLQHAGRYNEPAAARDDATLLGMPVLDKFPLKFPKRDLSLFCENCRHRFPLGAFNFLVTVEKMKIHLLGHQPANRAFAGAHEPDEVKVGCFRIHSMFHHTLPNAPVQVQVASDCLQQPNRSEVRPVQRR